VELGHPAKYDPFRRYRALSRRFGRHRSVHCRIDFQGSGRISFHDNVLIGGEPAAAVFRDHDLPLKLAEVFDNKIYSPHIGIEFGSPAQQGQSVFGNVIFAGTPIAGPGHSEGGNIVVEPVRTVERSASRQ
jgi:hypothetical protein